MTDTQFPTSEEIEAAARALARRRIDHNTRFDRPPKTEDFLQGCEDHAWMDFSDDAECALKAAMAVRRGK